ncbi:MULTISPECIES: UvrD-helicase domain-containing protein [unclassified Sphingomonas]|uniref:UvrD-helicase domain-containing protein n=1 Tax=unclassified Sphingomonas TaxID=196159 RepID=UPI0007015A97|nr:MULTISPECIES: UvrD-helicase domain-containing protein [unclassified Sphingomonas]KQX19177.1 RNA helicase [Sphingomonas sp. Root1294]KQY65378.1 RNA helicase [Sphingomonas sp. Root50]KRB95327.1 RNA helicase [Sphingomonas sp. Root720]
MTSRIGSPDTPADLQVRDCLGEARSFVMVAGAGSGKTTSLIKALAHLGETRGPALRRAGQQIACITFTEVAVGEISHDVGVSPLFHVSTIHSFLWSIVRPFQTDIAAWVVARIDEKIGERQERHAKPGTRAATRVRLEQEIADLGIEREAIGRVEKFTYETGSRYAEGILGHDDILRLTPACVTVHPLLRRIVARRFPYIFVDESQDTQPAVIEALRQIAGEEPLCVGFFGDPMQKIYGAGAGAIALNAGWADITKPENFRCPTSVLGVINAIRAPGDGLAQIRGRTVVIDDVEQPVEGTANIFILPADNQRSERLAAVRSWLAEQTADDAWLSDLRDGDVRLLVLVHRMAARRLGFADLYAALNDGAPQSMSEGIADGTAWPLRPFTQHLLPMIGAARADDQFAIMSILRAESPRLQSDRLRGQPVAPVLAALQQAVNTLSIMLAEGSLSTVRQVLQHVRNAELLSLDDRFGAHFVAEPVDDGSSGYANVAAFLDCGVDELWAHRRYMLEESPFATHHGVKGAQFERVLVVLDDEEAAYNLYSYGKYLGFTPLSDNDEARIAGGEESVLDRTRRLFYVCCSRAVKDLAVVLFVPDVAAARAAVTAAHIFPEATIRELHQLN